MSSPARDAAAPAVAAAERLAWVDVAKAAAIVLVVLYHVGTTGLAWLLPRVGGAGIDFWVTLNTVLLPLRMPLFFLVSGILAAPTLTRGWRELWHPRVLILLWPFALWTMLYSVPEALYRSDLEVSETVAAAALSIPFGGTGYWFLYALVVFFVVTRSLRRFGTALMLTAFVLLVMSSIIAEAVTAITPELLDPTLVVTVRRLTTMWFWFTLGCFGRGIVMRVADAGVVVQLIAALSFIALALEVYLIGSADAAFLLFGMSVTGLIASIVLARQLAQIPVVARFGRYVAQRTLPIYLVHPFALAVVIWLVVRSTEGDGIPTDIGAQWWLTPVLSIALVALSVGVYDLAQKTPLRYLFAAPFAPTRRESASP